MFTHVTFDLVDATGEDYASVKDGFQQISLADYVYSSRGRYIELPYNTFAGEYENIRNLTEFTKIVATAVKSVFDDCEVAGRAFVLCSGADFTIPSGYVWQSLTF